MYFANTILNETNYQKNTKGSNFSLDENVTVAVATSVLLTRSKSSLFSRVLQRNKIKSITKKAFEGLEALEDL